MWKYKRVSKTVSGLNSCQAEYYLETELNKYKAWELIWYEESEPIYQQDSIFIKIKALFKREIKF